jgi:hypothetical protein
MRKKGFGFALCAMLFALCFSAEAQPPKKLPRIAFLSTTDRATDHNRFEGIRQRLRELGYIEGRDIPIEYRLPVESSIGTMSLRPNWYVSRLIS